MIEKYSLKEVFIHFIIRLLTEKQHCLFLPPVLIFFYVHHRDELFRQSLAKLREQLVKANTLVREANFLAEEMSKLTDYQVTLQIPAANLSANRKVSLPLEQEQGPQ